MHTFFILCWISFAASEQLGYNYQPHRHDVSIGNGGFGGNAIGAGGSVAIGQTERGIGGGALNGAYSGFGGFVDNSGSGGITSSGSGLSFGSAPVDSSQYNKEFYTYSAPEEEFNDSAASQHISSSLKKNLRVVFIRAPENQGLANAALQLAKQASEDRTAIYVLNKQSDISDLANKLQSIKNSNSNKPEVHFVKYRTQEDAARAQQAIQAQFDSLGGQSHTSNEETAPVLNFASPVAAATSGFGNSHLISDGSSLSGSYGSPQASYLPPNLRLQ